VVGRCMEGHGERETVTILKTADRLPDIYWRLSERRLQCWLKPAIDGNTLLARQVTLE
jgi:hypothetical protein